MRSGKYNSIIMAIFFACIINKDARANFEDILDLSTQEAAEYAVYCYYLNRFSEITLDGHINPLDFIFRYYESVAFNQHTLGKEKLSDPLYESNKILTDTFYDIKIKGPALKDAASFNRMQRKRAMRDCNRVFQME